MSSQVEMVVNMLRPVLGSLSLEEKTELLAELKKLLGMANENPTPSGKSQSNTLSEVTFGSGNNALNFSPIQNEGGSVNLSPNFTQQTSTDADVQEVFKELVKLKQVIEQNKTINPLIKDGAKAQVEQLKQELQKPNPDPSFVSRSLVTLKQGLEGVASCADPAIKVASLVAKIWGIPVP